MFSANLKWFESVYIGISRKHTIITVMNLLRPSENLFCKMDYLVGKELLQDDCDYCLICMEMLVSPL